MDTRIGKIEVKTRVKPYQIRVWGLYAKMDTNSRNGVPLGGVIVGGRRGLIQIRKDGREKLTPFLLIVRRCPRTA